MRCLAAILMIGALAWMPVALIPLSVLVVQAPWKDLNPVLNGYEKSG